MAESKLNFENNSYSVFGIILCIQYAKPWPHSDIRSCCHLSLHAFTSRYDFTLLGHVFFMLKVYLHEIMMMKKKKKTRIKLYGCKNILHYFKLHLHNSFSHHLHYTWNNNFPKVDFVL